MSRSLTLLGILVAALLAAGAVYVLKPVPQGLVAGDVRAIVAEMLAERDAQARPPLGEMADLDPAQINPMIESYLLGNPQVLEKMANALESERRTAEAEQARSALASMQDVIYDDPDNVILGNPEGDVTLVEMFDYNCGYCRRALPDLATLMAEDPNLKVILKEFPILSDESVAAARVATIVARSDTVDYWAFHEALFSSRGQVTRETAIEEARKLGLNPVTLALDAEHENVTRALQKTYDLARALNVSGTPTYIIGNEIIPGAIGIDELRTRIANMRKCGSTSCPGSG